MTTRIDRFIGKYRWLSNFAPVNVLLDGVLYPTVEHAYQAAKTEDTNERLSIYDCDSPGGAKRLGRKVTLRSDWESVKVDVMNDLLQQKFRQPQYRLQLLQTGDATIVEGNNWGDSYWGVCRGEGQNMLGKIIMRVREELLAEENQ